MVRFLEDVLSAADGDAKNIDTISNRNNKTNVLKLLPIWNTCLTYTISYSQATTFFTKQASAVDRSLGPTINIPAASLRTFIAFSILFGITIYDQIFVLIAKKVTGYSYGITKLQRIRTGMAISVLNMVVTALAEMKRLKNAGALGRGNFLSSFLISAIEKVTSGNGRDSRLCDNLNHAHLDYFYWLLAGVGVLGLVVYAYLANSYKYEGYASRKKRIQNID